MAKGAPIQLIAQVLNRRYPLLQLGLQSGHFLLKPPSSMHCRQVFLIAISSRDLECFELSLVGLSECDLFL
jgi:hypothetical protein